MSAELRKDRKFILQLVSKDGQTLQWASKELKGDKDRWMLVCVCVSLSLSLALCLSLSLSPSLSHCLTHREDTLPTKFVWAEGQWGPRSMVRAIT